MEHHPLGESEKPRAPRCPVLPWQCCFGTAVLLHTLLLCKVQGLTLQIGKHWKRRTQLCATMHKYVCTYLIMYVCVLCIYMYISIYIYIYIHMTLYNCTCVCIYDLPGPMCVCDLKARAQYIYLLLVPTQDQKKFQLSKAAAELAT